MYPSDLCDLTHVSLQCPVNDKFTILKNVVGYSSDYFKVEDDYISMSVNCGNGTSNGSHYPRTEFKSNSVFNSSIGTHIVMDCSIMQVPIIKPVVCWAQIKTANAEMQFLYSHGRLVVRDFNVDHHDIGPCDLNTWFNVAIASCFNQVHVYLNGASVLTLSNTFTGASWKVGCYTQSNQTIDKPETMSKVCIKNLFIR